MSKKGISVLIGITVFISIGALLWVKSGWVRKMVLPKSKVISESERLADLRKKDLAALSSTSSSDGDVYGALVRLAQSHEVIAKQEAIHRSSSESTTIRRGVARALGYFDDEESTEILLKLMNDKDPLVRTAAIEGLGISPTAAREKVLFEFSKKKNLPNEERVLILASLINLAKSQPEKESKIKQIIEIISTEKNENLVVRASLIVMGLNPRSPYVIELLLKVLKSNRPLQLVPQAIRHLATMVHPWLQENLIQIISYPEPAARQAAIQSLHFVCPPNRWTILDRIMTSERDRTVVDAALREAVMMPGPEARAFLERQISSSNIVESEKQLATTLLSQVKASTSPDPCLK